MCGERDTDRGGKQRCIIDPSGQCILLLTVDASTILPMIAAVMKMRVS